MTVDTSGFAVPAGTSTTTQYKESNDYGIASNAQTINGNLIIGKPVQKTLPRLGWNVISKDEFEGRSKRIFEIVADVLSKTLGPFGATTIIERNTTEYKITKDGWNVLKSLRFSNAVEENILMLLVNIAQQVVRKVGDGSTSSVVSAHQLLEVMSGIFKEHNVRSKVLLEKLNKAADLIAERIKATANVIDREGDFSEIYNLAYVSTNENEEISRLIQQAYQATGSPSIQYAKSRTAKNELEIIDGYQSKMSWLDATFVNTDNESGDYQNVTTVQFDHTVEKEYHLDFILDLRLKVMNEGKRLLVIAPYFDTKMLETFAAICNQERSQTGSHHLLVARASLIKNHDFQMYKDLSVLLGGKVVTENVINEYVKSRVPQEERDKTYDPRLNGEVNEYISVDPQDYLGHVNKVTLGKRYSLFQDFTKTNKHELELAVSDADSKLAAQEAVDNELNTLNHDAIDLRERVMKLKCKTAIIKAGGSTTLEKGANYDLLEDAVKAAESAYKNGYNLGGNLAITLAVEDILVEHYQDVLELELEDIDVWILNGIKKSFENVLQTVIDNGQLDYSVEEIINQARHTGKCLNIVTGEYDGSVINPAMTDIEILKGTASIVSLMLSSNQYISLEPKIEVQ